MAKWPGLIFPLFILSFDVYIKEEGRKTVQIIIWKVFLLLFFCTLEPYIPVWCGSVGDFLKEQIEPDAELSFASAYFNYYAYPKLKDSLDSIHLTCC